MGKAGRIVWTPEEWLRVAANAVALVEAGKHKVEALKKAQRLALPGQRRRDDASLIKSTYPSTGTFDAALAAFSALSSDERAALVVVPAAPSPKSAPKPASVKAGVADGESGGARWTTREWALLARHVDRLKTDVAWADLPLRTLYKQAQTQVLPRDRWRAHGGIDQAGFSQKLAAQHAQGVADGWKYPEAEVASVAPAPEAAALASTTPAPAVNDLRLNPAVIAFGNTLMGALGELLSAHEHIVAERFTAALAASAATAAERIGPTVQQMLQAQVQQIVGHVEQGLRNVLLQELGGGGAAASAPAIEDAAPNTSTPAAILKIDVIGDIEAEWRTRIEDACRGHELRLVHPEKSAEFAPHRGRHLIVMQQTLPRGLKKKLEASGVKANYVRAAAGHVLRAIEDLVRAAPQGATLQ